MFSLAWQYLTGRCVATDFADRELAEWPPHPDRVFQALVAAWGERGENPMERKALEWLESLGLPQLVVPEIQDAPNPVKVYVPVNDIETRQKVYGDPMMGLLPERRHKSERFFPSIQVGEGVCALVWPDAESSEFRQILSIMCREVQRIGHSSSLVRCWIEEGLPGPVTHLPAPQARRRDDVVRVFEQGRLQVLCEHHQAILDKMIDDILPPRARQFGYVRAIPENTEGRTGDFSSPLLVFRQVGGRRFGLSQALDLTNALRFALIGQAEGISLEAKVLVSGHAPDGAPLRDQPHLAYMPLAFVGDDHADGHLMGMAIAFPKALDPVVEEAAYQAIGKLIDPKTLEIRLVLGQKGEMILQMEDRLAPAKALRSESWAKASRWWATTTPIVMDRMQNSRRSDPDGWAADQIGKMCERQGLPFPAQVVIRPASFLEGVPTVREFPPLVRKNGSTHRMVHAHISWESTIVGPLVLGAGRFKGYGLCKPCCGWEETSC
ncbi:MAG: type I-U CRISPR-associated protein Cas5/Cas6 [Fibrobacteres bacterium]|nr:type I-U CRISPR-associated protein Cas5/Cas6 [Fibrobacterota bacterium]